MNALSQATIGSHLYKIAITLTVSASVMTSSGCLSTTSEVLNQDCWNYTYHPLNPTTVWIRDPTPEERKEGYGDADETSFTFNKALLRDLDTETVRIALSLLSGNSNMNAGVVGVSVEGQSYLLIVDYIKYLSSAKEIDIEYRSSDTNKGIKKYSGVVPVYIGVGLRIRAEFKAHKSGLDISGLPAIALAASTSGIDGRLTVQTMGITGTEVTGLLPIISDISITSIQNAVQAVAAIKAKVYEESTTVYPKIVGFESPDCDLGLIKAITQDLYGTKAEICPVVTEKHEDTKVKVHAILWPQCPLSTDSTD